MDIFSFLSLVGGLAIFLFGMQVMGDGLEKRCGGKLKGILESMTSSPIKGVLLGAGVTAIIQSSSATTVMVVGFVNSGLMQLSQAIGVIMGANIGTTVTAWLLSLTGVQGDNIFIQLLKPSSFSPVLALIGIIFLMFFKGTKKEDSGMIMLGFAVLMTGMELMSDSVSGLAESDSFARLFTLFTNPILGILAGAVLTAIIQSSSASVGILQALSVTGAISYSAAIPIILGQNIGTCATALLASIGTNKNARRTAMAHLSFNIIGSAVFIILFMIIRTVGDLAFIDSPINAAGIAIVHTTFNCFATALLLPFTKQLEKLAILLVPDDNKKEEISLLDERLFATPSVAVNRATQITAEMGLIAKDSLLKSLNMIYEYQEKDAQEIRDEEKKVDRYEDRLGTYLVKLSRENLSAKDSDETSKILHCIGDFERISDHAVNIVESAEEMRDKGLNFSREAISGLRVMTDALTEIINMALQAFTDNDLEKAKSIEPLEQIIDGLKIKLRDDHIIRLQKNECNIETGFVFSDLLTNMERVADHCSNIGVCILESAVGGFDTHEYLRRVKKSGENEFFEQYDRYKEKYEL